jgi:hypothetical protein
MEMKRNTVMKAHEKINLTKIDEQMTIRKRPGRDPRWQLGCGSRQCELCDSKALLGRWSHTWWE